jgi:predicted nucleic acid-binding protein
LIVVDASAMVEVLLRTQGGPAVEARLFEGRPSLHTPHLLDVEVAQVIRRHVARHQISEERGDQAIVDLIEFPMRRYPHTDLLPRAWELRHSLTAHDAVYVALAEVLDAPLITRDRRLAAASGHRAMIELV